MAYLVGARAWREAAATLWLMVLGAGLLATSRPGDGGPLPNTLWSGPGPVVTLSDADPARAFAVTLLVPRHADIDWQAPEQAQVSFSVSAQHGDASSAGTTATTGGSTGQAGAAPDPVAGSSPWITAAMRDSSQVSLLDSTPFLSTWGGTTSLDFIGDCAAPDPAGADPCRLSFTVEFARSPSGTPAATELTWSLDFSATVSGAEPGTDVGWTAEIEPL